MLLLAFFVTALILQMRSDEPADKSQVAEDEPKKWPKKLRPLFPRKGKEASESKYVALAESHVPCFQERGGTGIRDI
jgi:hypothetical protein